MTKVSVEDGSKQDNYVFAGILLILFVTFAFTIYPSVQAFVEDKFMDHKMAQKSDGLSLQSSKTPKEYYDMFQCSCCGKSIDVGCCGMAKQRKQYVDELLLEGLQETEVVYEMVKKFGFDILMEGSMEEEVKEYIKSQAPANPAELTLDRIYHDFGTIKQTKDIVSTDFTVKNTGKSDLIIENLDTSCMCTSAQLIYKGEESPTFGMSMHGTNPKDFELKIPPGESAVLRVFYDPMAHGKQKKPEMSITREVTIVSNDPVNFQTKVKIELTQVL